MHDSFSIWRQIFQKTVNVLTGQTPVDCSVMSLYDRINYWQFDNLLTKTREGCDVRMFMNIQASIVRNLHESNLVQ